MEILFLGTSAGVPTRKRNMAATVIKRRNSKNWYLVDCGEGTQHRILSTPLTINNLNTILITHMHGDHCYGLPGLLASATMCNRQKTLTIAGPKELELFVKTNQKTTHIEYPFSIKFIDLETYNSTISTPDFDVTFTKLSHRIDSYGFAFKEKNIHHKLDIEKLSQAGIPAGPIWNRLQKGENIHLDDGQILQSKSFLLKDRTPRKVIIAGDNDQPDLLTEIARGSDLVIHEATFTEEIAIKIGNAHQHSTARKVALFADQMEIPNLILTHFSPRFQKNRNNKSSIFEVEKEARKYYRGNLFLANDLEMFRLNWNSEIQKNNLISNGVQSCAPLSPMKPV